MGVNATLFVRQRKSLYGECGFLNQVRTARSKASVGFVPFMLDGLVLFYLVSVAVFNKDESLSILSTATALLILALLFTKFLATGKMVFPKLIWIPIAFVIFNLLSDLWAYSFVSAANDSQRTMAGFIGAIALWLALYNGVSWRILSWGLGIGAAIVIISMMMGVTTMVEGDMTREGGVFGNPNEAAVYLSMIGFLLYIPARDEALNWIKAASCGGLIILTAVMTGSRKTIFSVVLFFMYVITTWIHRNRGSWRAPAIAVGVTLLVVMSGSFVWNYVQDVPVIRRAMLYYEGTEASADNRVVMAEEAMELWRERPIFGQGAGQFAALTKWDAYSHNDYTELLCNLGLFGLLLYYSLHLAIIAVAVRPALKGSATHQAALAIVLLMLLMDTATVSYVSKTSWISIALAAALVGSTKTWSLTPFVENQQARLGRP